MEVKVSRKETIQLDEAAMKEIIALGLEAKYGKTMATFKVNVQSSTVTTGYGTNEHDTNIVSATAERDIL